MDWMLSDNRKIGGFMLCFGILFMFLGVIFFFDKALLALGNILFLGAFPLMIGFSRTLKFFNPWKKGTEKLKGIVCFFCGILLVLFGWPMVGILVEAYGIFKLFGSFFPIMIKSIQGFISSIFGTESSLLRKMGGIKESGV
jgi:hypothetical protein